MPLPEPTVTVTVTAEREVPPDSFEITARIEVARPDSVEAGDSLARGYALLEQGAAGLPGSVEVRHGTVSTWSSTGKRPTWHAGRTMTLTGSDLTAVGEIMSAFGALPAIALHGPQWRLTRDNPAHAELQTQAVHEARARAERYAVALGGRLGALVELSDPDSGGRGRVFATADWLESDGDLGQLDLTPQPIGISATVNARWGLLLTTDQ